MLKLWEHYVNAFRRLIVGGWIVVKRNGSPVHYYVYPNTSLPTKFTLREAYGILENARSIANYGSTSGMRYHCRMDIYSKGAI